MTEESASRRRGGRGRTRPDVFELGDFIAHYQPRAEDRWPEVADFVRDCVARSGATTYPHAHRITRALTMHALFCLDHQVPLDVEAVLHPDRIDHFLAAGIPHSKSRGSYRFDLRFVGEKLTRRAPYRPTVELGRASPNEPYKPEDLRSLWRTIDSQSTPARRQAGEALMLLGLGAGLDGRWAARIRREDVRVLKSERVVIEVPRPNARRVPVDVSLAERLVAFTDSVTTSCLVGLDSASPNRTAGLIANLRIPLACPPLQMRRLRATWLVGHLALGTPLPHLLRAAGLGTAATLVGLLPHAAEALGPAEWEQE